MTTDLSGDPVPSFIHFGSVLVGAKPFSFNQNVNPVYRGQVMLKSGAVVNAFIKDLTVRELANELFAGALGLRLGLPIPTPIIARAGPDILPATQITLSGTEDHILFASHAVGAVPILQLLRDAGPETGKVMEALSKWPTLGRLYGFDAWVANVDRHRGNLLMSGQGDVWMIDHGQCFTGPEWQAPALVAADRVCNRLKEWLTPALTAKRRSEAQADAEALASDAARLGISGLGDAAVLTDVLGSDFDAIVSYLEARASYVPELSKEALELLV